MNLSIITVLLLTTLMLRTGSAMITTHFKCRGGVYPRSTTERFPVPDDKVSWAADYPDYKPKEFTFPGIRGKPWADPDIRDANFHPKWNELDGNVNRKSHIGKYEIKDSVPLNPIGRTGIVGQGVLGRWGPNHAADPVVTRWKRCNNSDVDTDQDNRSVLQFIAIKRGDTGEWALPGGMVDPGEKVAATAIREFQEEATNSLTMTQDEKKLWRQKFQDFFSAEAQEVYRGYVDDRRNTDNAWIETVAYNFHDEKGSTVDLLKLQAGDDAVGVQWVDITPQLKLYANHKEIIMEVYRRRMADSR